VRPDRIAAGCKSTFRSTIVVRKNAEHRLDTVAGRMRHGNGLRLGMLYK